MLYLLPNIVVKHPQIDVPQVIVYANPSHNVVAAIDAEGIGRIPQFHHYGEWTEMLNAGVLELIDNPYVGRVLPHQLTASMVERQSVIWPAIEPLVKRIPEILVASKRRQMILERAREISVSQDAIRNWMCEYWQRGATPSALLGNRNSCGRHRTSTSITAASPKLGRPRTRALGVGLNVDERALKYFRVAIAQIFHKKKRINIYQTYLKTLRTFLPEAVRTDEKGKVKIINSEAIPTYRQFRYWLHKETDIFTTAIAKCGLDFYQKTLRPLLGNSTVDSIGPGYRYQIDATIGDVYLLSRADRRKLVGRPVVYVVIDVWSRLIVGLYVGLENASWTVAMMALHNVTLDKVEYCKQFGIDIEASEWPNALLANVVMGDRFEMISKHSTGLATHLDIEVENTPPYRADWKGPVERSFGTLPAPFVAEAPGYVDKDYQPRSDPDYRLDAKLTLYEFTQVMIHCVLCHNNTLVTGYPLENEMVAEGVTAIPTELWKWGIQTRMGKMKKHSQDKLLLALLPTSDKASITGNGVLFLGREYYSDEVHAGKWFSKARRGRISVTVSYHPHNLNTILLHIGDKGFVVCTLKSTELEAQDLSFEEVMAVHTKAAKAEAEKKIPSMEAEMTAQHAIENIIEGSIEAVEALGPDTRSKAERLGGMKDNRFNEKMDVRVEQGGDGRSPPRKANASNPIRTPASPIAPEAPVVPATGVAVAAPVATAASDANQSAVTNSPASSVIYKRRSVIEFDDDD